MTLPRWDDELKFELFRLKSELKAENFRVLHHPIGLGQVTKKVDTKSPKANKVASEVRAPSAAAPHTRSSSSSSSSSPFRPAPHIPKLPPPKPEGRLSRNFSKLFIIHALDVAFVLMTIGLGLLLATWVIDPKHISENPELLRQATPLRFLVKSNAFALVLGLYGFFSLYWLFFKLVTGSTLGESFLDNFWSLQNPRSRPSVKDSGDS